MEMPGRTFESDDYRYGFNGMEKDQEMKDGQNDYTTHFRAYDARVGRWKSLDPEMNNLPSLSPYLSMDGNPIMLNDPDGDCTSCPNRKVKQRLRFFPSGGGPTQRRANVRSGGTRTLFTQLIVNGQNVIQNAQRTAVRRDKLNPFVENRPGNAGGSGVGTKPSLFNNLPTRSASMLAKVNTNQVEVEVIINIQGLNSSIQNFLDQQAIGSIPPGPIPKPVLQFLDPITGTPIANTGGDLSGGKTTKIVPRTRNGLASVRVFIPGTLNNTRGNFKLNAVTNVPGVAKSRNKHRRKS